MNKWGMKGIVLGLCLSMMAPMAVAMVPEMSVKAENGKTANDSKTESIETTEEDIKEKLIESGYPRNDFISNITEQEIDNLKEKYNITKDKKVILYAPTWRDNSFSDKGYIFKLQVDFKLWK